MACDPFSLSYAFLNILKVHWIDRLSSKSLKYNIHKRHFGTAVILFSFRMWVSVASVLLPPSCCACLECTLYAYGYGRYWHCASNVSTSTHRKRSIYYTVINIVSVVLIECVNNNSNKNHATKRQKGGWLDNGKIRTRGESGGGWYELRNVAFWLALSTCGYCWNTPNFD